MDKKERALERERERKSTAIIFILCKNTIFNIDIHSSINKITMRVQYMAIQHCPRGMRTMRLNFKIMANNDEKKNLLPWQN